MNRFDHILEDCLQAIEQGDTIETVVARYPQFADDLRPILEAAVSVKNKSMFTISPEVVRRNRAKLLQHAATLREAQMHPTSQWTFAPLRRLAVTLLMLLIVFASGTSLVRASSATVPGDSLYPVKRTWEGMLLLVTVDDQQREALELEQEGERLEELEELFEAGRSARVDFSGLVTMQNPDQWAVSGVNVLISADTTLPTAAVQIGAGIRVIGHAQNGFVQAESIELISLNELATLPASVTEISENEQTPQVQPGVTVAASTPEPEAPPIVDIVETAQPSQVYNSSFKGIVQAMNGNTWIINGVQVDTSHAQISGVAALGVVAKVKGYFEQSGLFIATRIQLPENQTTGGDDNSSISPSATPRSQPEGTDDHEDNVHDQGTETPEPEH